MKTKIAQGYNPDRVTVEELGEGYRLVPRRYLDRSKYDLTDVAQAWDGDGWDSNLDWADEDDSHRTLLSNAQLGMMTAARKKPTAVDVEANLVAPNVVRWRQLSEDERQIILKNPDRVDVDKFRHLGGRMLGLFGCPADHYATTMSREEILDLEWRDLTDAERKALRALHGTPRSLRDSRRFRHNATSSGDWHFGDCVFYPNPNEPDGTLRYQTDLTPAELATLLAERAKLVDWRKVTEDERTKLELWASRPGFDPRAVDRTKFRVNGSDVHTGLTFAYKSLDYTTTLTPDELAKLVEPPEVWRPLSLAEVRLLQHVAQASRRAATLTPYDWRRFRCKFLSNPYHQFRVWDFGSSATDYQTTYTEQEIACMM